MRALIVLAALLATAACSVDVNGGKGHGPYSVEIRAVGDTHVYVVRGPNNTVAAARSGDGESALLNADQLQHALAAMPTPNANPNSDDQSVSIRAPGFNMRVQGDDVHEDSSAADSSGKPSGDTQTHTAVTTHGVHIDTDDSGDHTGHGQVSMNIGGFGMQVNADDGGPGDADDRAQVTLSGLSAHDARHFIVEQDDLSPQVQAQMIAALGLPANDPDGDADHHLAGGNDNRDKPSGK